VAAWVFEALEPDEDEPLDLAGVDLVSELDFEESDPDFEESAPDFEESEPDFESVPALAGSAAEAAPFAFSALTSPARESLR
jgi:hypothetical protein